jgi:hypothetical protein
MFCRASGSTARKNSFAQRRVAVAAVAGAVEKRLAETHVPFRPAVARRPHGPEAGSPTLALLSCVATVVEPRSSSEGAS